MCMQGRAHGYEGYSQAKVNATLICKNRKC